ncbi:MFS transporter [Kerstersia sp.]|uniref:MFS transporter n=1 Tax=Kerstersia sp. TaxID=1930783 RepID=UPI003F92FC09
MNSSDAAQASASAMPDKRKVRLTIFLSVSLSTLGVTIILPILAPLIRELGLSESQGGWMVSVGSVVMALCGAWWGRRSDTKGRKAVILAGFAGLCVSYLVYTLIIGLGLYGVIGGMTLFALLLAGRAFVGMFLPAVPTGAQSYMADITTPEERSSGMAVIGAANGVGMVLGPALAGTLAIFGLIWPMVLATVLPLLAWFVVRRVLPAAPPRHQAAAPRLSPLDPRVLPWLLICLINILCIVTLQISAGFYFQDRLGLTTASTARVLAGALTLVGVTLMLTQVVQIRLLRWQPRRLVAVGAALVGGGLLVLLATHSMAMYYLAYIFIGCGAGMIFPGFMSGASVSVDREHQGAVAGLIAAAQGTGAIIAPIASTTLYEISPTWPFSVLVALMAAAWLVAVVWLRRLHPAR